MALREFLLSSKDVRKLKAGQKFGELKLIRHADRRGEALTGGFADVGAITFALSKKVVLYQIK
jgi:hypothetical protein